MTTTDERPPTGLNSARTLTESLRQLNEPALARLFTLRPDLAYPTPTDIADLSTQATTTNSVGRALDALNAWQRLVAEGLAALPDPGSVPTLAELLQADEADCVAAVDDLRQRALLWGADHDLHLVRAVRDHLGPYPGGLAPPSPRSLPADRIDELLAEAGPEARLVVERLLWSPAGTVSGADRVVTIEGARTPVEQLLARRLLRPAGPDMVLLPREVAWHLRGQRFTALPVPPVAPRLTGRIRTPQLVDRAAIGAAYGLVHDVELLAHTVETTAYRLLRDGGLGVRDLTAMARVLGSDNDHAAFVLEVTAAAELIAGGDGQRLLPTADYDRWAEREPADRWRALAAAWRHSDRLPGLSSAPGGHPLGAESAAPGAATVRDVVLDLLAAAEIGTTIDLEQVRNAVDWRLPRLVRVGGVVLESVLAWTWRETGWLGISSLQAVSGLGRAALSADSQSVPTELSEAFPATVEQVILQADLTAVAPGPVPYQLARELRLLADQESRGGAAVFRFSSGSLRRAFDAGWSAAEVHRWLEHHAATAVPQPLTYLIDDVARRHGSIRVGPARAYVQVADEAQTAAILAHPDAAVLGLRELAPGVLISAAEPYEMVDFLHRIGHSPAAEDSSGGSITAPDPLRAPRRGGHRPRPDVQANESAVAVLMGERTRHQHRREPVGPTADASTAQTLEQIAAARQTGETLRIHYVAADGRPAHRELREIGTDAGVVSGVDARDGRPISIPLARVSSIVPSPA
ncbi:MAG: helicase-associated domain-containing protein [Microlunatus sp.]